MSPVLSRRTVLMLQLSALFVAFPAFAQSAIQSSTEPTRGELTERARVADSLGRHQEAEALRTRLRDGDFDVGDQILVQYEGPGLTRRDSLVVMSGKVLRLGEPLGDLSVAGILRFEVQDLIKGRVDRYFKNEVVHTTALTRLVVSGAVRVPGAYHVRPDAPVADILMRAAGADANGDPDKIVIRRGQQLIWGAADVKAAIGSGITVEGLHLESGDEINVGARSKMNWTLFAQAGVTIATSLILALIVKNH